MTRIAFIGVGAVGGYFGGLMSEYYKDSKGVEVYLICKESTAFKIKHDGLKLETTHGDYQIHPILFSIKTHSAIVFDYLVCCTKSFDLQSSLLPLRFNIGNQTVIIPLLNGVESYDGIKSLFPHNEVWDACVYIVSRLIGTGYIRETGSIQLLFFGSRNQYSNRLKMFEQMFIHAGIKAKHSENILQTIWEKFIFISSIATLTSYLNKTIGEILSNDDDQSLLHQLLGELKTIASAKNIGLPENSIDSIYKKIEKLPFEATSSMHSDFQNKQVTELETITGVVVRMANGLGLPVPVYEKLYEGLKAK